MSETTKISTMWPGKKSGIPCPACQDVVYEIEHEKGNGFINIVCPKCRREHV